MPAGHRDGFCAAYVRHRGHNHVAEAQWFADQDNFKFDRSANCQLPGTEKIDAGRADVSSNEAYRGLLGHSAGAAKAQRKIQSGARIFAMLWVDADGVRGYPYEAARLKWTQERRHAEGRHTPYIWYRLWPNDCLARLDK
jgi:hypothetical protein